MALVMQRTVVKPTPVGMFVGNAGAELDPTDPPTAHVLDQLLADGAAVDDADLSNVVAPLLDDAGNPVDLPAGDLDADVAAGGQPVAAPAKVRKARKVAAEDGADADAAPADDETPAAGPVAGDEAPAA